MENEREKESKLNERTNKQTTTIWFFLHDDRCNGFQVMITMIRISSSNNKQLRLYKTICKMILQQHL